MSDQERATYRAHQRKWWAESPRAEEIRQRRNERLRERRQTEAGEAMRTAGRIDQRERRRRKALLDTTRVINEPDRNDG
jgi:hypothetical protein